MITDYFCLYNILIKQIIAYLKNTASLYLVPMSIKNFVCIFFLSFTIKECSCSNCAFDNLKYWWAFPESHSSFLSLLTGWIYCLLLFLSLVKRVFHYLNQNHITWENIENVWAFQELRLYWFKISSEHDINV